jgi:hypothetical protein
MSRTTLALLGGPASGKTTYLGALLDGLESGASSRFVLDGSPSDATAHDRLIEPLLDARYPQRTKAERNRLELPLRMVEGSEAFTLLMGDYDGEEVERLFQDRTRGFSEEWKARSSARGLLLFVRPDALVALPKLDPDGEASEDARWKALTGKQRADKRAPHRVDRPERVFGPGLAEETPLPPRAAPDHPVRVPTALAVIELLQFLRHVRGLDPGERPPPGELRIAFVASAWDAVDRSLRDAGPAGFLAQQAPLLEDYLWSNFHADDVFRFGLSATGGDLRDPRYQEQYRTTPGGFVEWADATGTIVQTSDLSLPIAWLLSGDRALAQP